MPATRPTHTNPTKASRIARAPYNFVPLPERIVTVSRRELPRHDRYEPGTYTGWFDCELETCSPTYTRGMMTPEQFEKYNPETESELSDEEQAKLKASRAAFYSASEEKVGGRAVPMIPGSSLRGLIRSLVEIAGYGKMQWLNNGTKVTFRAVAASREDPLAEPYRSLIGPFSRNVLAGYLRKTQGGGWEIEPALKPKMLDWPERAAYLRVKDSGIRKGTIKDFVGFNHPDYCPEWYPVSFSIFKGDGPRGPYVKVQEIGNEDAGYPHRGALVCTGNMIESLPSDRTSERRKEKIDSPRRNHSLILARDSKAKPVPIDEELLNSYLESLTPFQREELWKPGGLEDGAPVFYVLLRGKVLWFGHTPNFRVPALNRKGNLANPVDFVPEEIQRSNKPDLAEAIFGWIDEGRAESTPEADDRTTRSRAGRVSFADAVWIPEDRDIWYSSGAIAPSVLGRPKITTFQHYLVQDRSKGHDPDFRQNLAHYGSDPSTTQIRGHKLYWHKGNGPVPEATADQKETQLTRIIPLKPGVRFTFRVHFENLRNYELGAVAWALQPAAESNRAYRHKLGMGKPLGMGSVRISANLTLTERLDNQRGRYARFIADGRFATGENAGDKRPFIADFEERILSEVGPNGLRLTDLPRVRLLLAMLQWRESRDEWLNMTRYLRIDHPQYGNEYKDRPVLPTPLVLGQEADGQETEEDRLGIIVYIPPGRSFGYIKPDVPKPGEDPNGIFFRFKDLAPHFASREDVRVRFRVRNSESGPEAHDVRPERTP